MPFNRMRPELRSNVKKRITKKVGIALSELKKQKEKKRRKTTASVHNEAENPKKNVSKAVRSQVLLDEYGLCPISMQPMRRAVLPSSGQAYDEISLVRYA